MNNFTLYYSVFFFFLWKVWERLTPLPSCLFLSALGLSCNMSYPDRGRHSFVLFFVWLGLGNEDDKDKGNHYICPNFYQFTVSSNAFFNDFSFLKYSYAALITENIPSKIGAALAGRNFYLKTRQFLSVV